MENKTGFGHNSSNIGLCVNAANYCESLTCTNSEKA